MMLIEVKYHHYGERSHYHAYTTTMTMDQLYSVYGDDIFSTYLSGNKAIVHVMRREADDG
jgi:hypothetical protein